ncbi:DUF4382 domain-containing protein [Salinibaculum rarum]|uniref:DUF4382 domain-containing protein n=1 Tax=Salinibaculum rarum TaxID=3058903 RepID=UPI00265DDAEE|nr:DUF4382 domain-containing protein [Salinibaculum sp. KK48]
MTSHSQTDDRTDTETLGRRAYLGATGMAAAALSGLAGCLGGGGDGTGTLATRVKDQPGDIADFESCVVTIDGIWVAPGADETTTDTTAEDTEDGRREYYQFDEPQEADLVQLQDGNTKLVGEQELPTDEYAYLQLDVASVDATLTDGGEATITTPGDAPLKFAKSFEIRADETTTFTADFTPVNRGQTGSYVFKPVADGVSVSYE